MKIYLTITPFFPTKESFRGPYILDQVKALQHTQKYQVVVLKPKSFLSKETDYEYDGIIVYRFNVYNLPSNILPGLFAKLSCLSLFKKLKQLNINLNEISIAHTHSTNNGYLVNALKRKNPSIKTILQHHGFDVLNLKLGILSKYKCYRSFMQHYSTRICNKIDLHVGVSNKTIDYLQSYKDIRIKNHYILYNGVDLNKFHPIEGLKNTTCFTIGCIANFWPLKDQLTLIKAAQQLIENGMKDLRVIFIGSGATLKVCTNYIMANKLADFMEFRKEVKHQELVKFYNSIDLFVLPSYWEAFGCVYTESYACNTPFIAVKDQGISELIVEEEKHKWLIDKSNATQLARLIKSYRETKYKQKLNSSIDINSLISVFLNKLETIKHLNNS